MLLYIVTSFIWWQIFSAIIVSAGMHRYFSHRAFKAPIWYEYLVLSLATFSGSGPMLGWAGVHRLHHNNSDTKHDPHSPAHQSKWKILLSTFDVPHISPRIIKDLLRNKRVMWFYKHHLQIRITSMLFLAILLPLPWFIVLCISPMIYGYLGFGIINAFCHRNGQPINSHIANIFSSGEGFHKNHHEDQRNWRVGRHWYEFDPAAYFIKLIKIN